MSYHHVPYHHFEMTNFILPVCALQVSPLNTSLFLCCHRVPLAPCGLGHMQEQHLAGDMLADVCHTGHHSFLATLAWLLAAFSCHSGGGGCVGLNLGHVCV